MSRTAAAAATRPAPRQPARRPEPARVPLRLVAPAPWRPPRAPFVVLSLAIVGLGLLGLLGLNTIVAQDAFRMHTLERQSARLAADEQRLQREVALLEAPGTIAGKARELGLVPAGDPAFLRLSDGAVLGMPKPASAAPVPSPVAKASPAAKESPSAKASPAAKASPSAKASPAAKASVQPTAASPR